LKVIDFGLARSFDSETRWHDLVGTAYYVAPELLAHDHGPKIDMWACGVIAYTLLGGYAPFEGDDDKEVLRAVAKGDIVFGEESWKHVSEDAKGFVTWLLTYDEDDRPTAVEALGHEWLQRHRRGSWKVDDRRASTRASLTDLQQFQSRRSILKQATCAMMASQLQHSDEIKDIGQAFQILDQQGCGKLTKADVQASLAAILDENDEADRSKDEAWLKNIDIDLLFEQVNFSGTGTIHYSEFVGACLMQKSLLDDSKVEQIFQTYDKSHKGFITREDLKEALYTNSRISDRTIAKIMRQTGRQGRIYFNDFRANMLGHKKAVASTKASCGVQRAFHFQSKTEIPIQFGAMGA